MPNIAVFHPQIVHFVVALMCVGVLFRLLALTGRWSWMNNAAAALIILGALASVPAVRSGADAHGIVERIPGARAAVVEHEEWGERTRNLFLCLAAIEILALVLSNGRQRAARLVAAAVGLAGVFFIYETGEHGGELVYAFAGGVGTRSGEPKDVERLLMAGLYHQAMADRKAGKHADAAALISEMARRFGSEFPVRQLAVESQLRDRGDTVGARAAVDSLLASAPDDRTKRSATVLKVDILAALGHKDSARTLLEPLAGASPRLKAKLDSLK